MVKPETVSQEARSAAEQLVWSRTGEVCSNANDGLVEDIALAIMDAKAEERAECLRIVMIENLAEGQMNSRACSHIEFAIRKRGDVNTAHNQKVLED